MKTLDSRQKTAEKSHEILTSYNDIFKTINELKEISDDTGLKNLPITPTIHCGGKTFWFEYTRRKESQSSGCYGYASSNANYFPTNLAAMINGLDLAKTIVSSIERTLDSVMLTECDYTLKTLSHEAQYARRVEFEYRNHDDSADNYDEDMNRAYDYPVYIKGISEHSSRNRALPQHDVIFNLSAIFKTYEALFYIFSNNGEVFSNLVERERMSDFHCRHQDYKINTLKEYAESLKACFIQTYKERDALFLK